MRNPLPGLTLALALLGAAPAFAATGGLSIGIAPSSANPATPQMGDRLTFHSEIRNTGDAPVDGVIAWLGLVRVDKGQEQPVGLEDWSAEKAVTEDVLPPGGTIETDWPMRLIAEGHYRVVVSAASRGGPNLASSPFADFTVRPKPVVESRRVLPVAIGVPVLLALGFLVRRTVG